jgi:hypothetical protein
LIIDLAKLEKFGDVAAEDDAVIDYFLETDEVAKIRDHRNFLVLGRKGSGKTAIVRYFTERNANNSISKALNLRGYPWTVHAKIRDAGATEMETYVASWRYLIAVELASVALGRVTSDCTEQGTPLRQYLIENYGGIEPSLPLIVRPDKLRAKHAAIEPTVLGNKIGSVSLSRTDNAQRLGLELNALTDALLAEVLKLIGVNGFGSIYLHFDELDRGLTQLDDSRAAMLTGLILASREIRNYSESQGQTVLPLVYLRSDLWELLHFSDKNKITQASAITLEWTSESLQKLVELRASRLLGIDLDWSDLEDHGVMRGSQSKWSHLVSRTFLRPRDVIAYLNSALDALKARSADSRVFTNRDITEAREGYSAYLKKEIDDEIVTHLPEWEDVVQTFSSIRTITFNYETFHEEYRKRSSTGASPPPDVLKTLYEFSVIGYESRSGYGGSSFVFHYSNPEAQWDPSATRFKVHLGLKEFAKLREERG